LLILSANVSVNYIFTMYKHPVNKFVNTFAYTFFVKNSIEKAQFVVILLAKPRV